MVCDKELGTKSFEKLIDGRKKQLNEAEKKHFPWNNLESEAYQEKSQQLKHQRRTEMKEFLQVIMMVYLHTVAMDQMFYNQLPLPPFSVD